MNETEQLAARDLEPEGVLLGPFPRDPESRAVTPETEPKSAHDFRLIITSLRIDPRFWLDLLVIAVLAHLGTLGMGASGTVFRGNGTRRRSRFHAGYQAQREDRCQERPRTVIKQGKMS